MSSSAPKGKRSKDLVRGITVRVLKGDQEILFYTSSGGLK